MFDAEQRQIEEKINAFCTANGLPEAAIQWKWIPFSGQWGISAAFFQLAAQEARQGKKIQVNQRAQELASQIAQLLGTPAGFEKTEAVNGYLNLYFDPAVYARRVIDTAIEHGSNFGKGASRSQQVMVEFSQPNTHKAFHVGHLRSAIVGDGISRL